MLRQCGTRLVLTRRRQTRIKVICITKLDLHRGTGDLAVVFTILLYIALSRSDNCAKVVRQKL